MEKLQYPENLNFRLLQDFPYFLYRAYTGLNRNIFNELLSIVEKIVRTKVDDDKVFLCIHNYVRIYNMGY